MGKQLKKAAAGTRGPAKTVRIEDGRFLGAKITTRDDLRRDTYSSRDSRAATN